MSPIRLLIITFLLLSLPVAAQDVLTVGSVAAPAGTRVSVPVSIRDAGGTALGMDAAAGLRIQGVVFRVRITPAGSATNVTFDRAGIAASLTPLYERAIAKSDSIAYIATFPEALSFVLNAAAPGNRIGTISLTIADGLAHGSKITLGLDADATSLSNQDSTENESVPDTSLTLVSGTVTVGGSPTTVAVTSSANPSLAGEPVTFTASVTSQTAGTIRGTMYFSTNGEERAIIPVVGGTASFTESALPEGTSRITAVYEGWGTFQPGTSALLQTVNSNVIAAPGAVAATAPNPTQVQVTWLPVASAASYEILRRSIVNGADTVVGTSSSTSFSDLSALPGKTYLYGVRALTAGGARSASSAFDPATTTTFSDQPLSAPSVVRRVHLTELRAAVNEYRRAAGLPAYVFAENPLPSAAKVRRVHIEQLRDAVSQARAFLGLPGPPLTDPSLASITLVRAVHFQELRDALR